ncbi:DUF2079 domain-containing protein [Prochlorococcus sp. MIT 1341]|uniref:DUF2079 domain-containing protein n=1 Tax=Prochlorococcus sp. MIT 1341 TaxID=3096221 RepID=UPI002A765ABA|nr:DUF2079 domain-containing protein [Prochlorococcus sp. MIT 1341]
MKPAIEQSFTSDRHVWLAASIFFFTCLLLQVWRMQSLTSSMDQGILYQILWNGLQGHPFESTLSSQLSSNVVHTGDIPTVGYHRLGQHFTPILIIWLPLISLMGKWALPILQVALITLSGLFLYQLAKLHLKKKVASMITFSYLGANAVIGPCLGNFTDLAQLPLTVFALIIGIETRNKWLILIPALAIPLIREDTGVVLMGIGLWVILRQRKNLLLGSLLLFYGGAWVLIATNLLMPIFSDDTSKRFMVENFGQYLQGKNEANSLEVIKLALQQPLVIIKEIVTPPGQTLRYLLGQFLPLMFIPLISLDSWVIMGLPLLGLLMAQGNPLAINWRYTYLVVPGIFSGSIYWWKNNPNITLNSRLKSIWVGCILLSLIFTLTSNPNRTISWLMPESINPWVYHSPFKQWKHSRIALKSIQQIPPNASVSASSTLVPHLASREALIRFPYHIRYKNRQGETAYVDWVVADIYHHQKYASSFKNEWKDLQEIIQVLQNMEGKYSPVFTEDGIVLFQLNGKNNPKVSSNYKKLLEKISSITPPKP